MTPTVCILRTDGTNCDGETAYAFEKAGGLPRSVHVNQLRSGADSLMNYAILAIPGGFSYGDDVAAGAILANELISYLRDQLQAYVEAGRLVIGICNGFQVLVRTGLLPNKAIGEVETTLTINDSGRFECRWIEVAVAQSCCVFTQSLEGCRLHLPVAHGEGKFVAAGRTLLDIERRKQCVMTYANGDQPMETAYPQNPNGSVQSIAGICDPTGRIFGLMPHPERFVEPTQHPNRRRFNYGRHGLAIFEDGVQFAKGF